MMRRRCLQLVPILCVLGCVNQRAPVLPAAPHETQPQEPAFVPTRLEPVPRLASRARALADRAQPLEASRLLLRELGERLEIKPWHDEALVSDSIIAAIDLEALLEQTTAWQEALDALAPRKPFDAATPPELVSQLDYVLARALVRVDRVDEARDLVRSHGALADWRIAGPFANERGGGFDTSYPPEEGVDLAAVMRGKEREVSWRPNPGPEQPLANLLLNEMLRPNEQSVAYLATAISLEKPRSVCLLLGTTGAVKVWHDGALVLARKVSRPFHRDQDRIVLALQPGWNRLLFKVGVDENEPWITTARVTELDGRPIAKLACDSSHAADATKAGAASSESAPKRTIELLEARTDDAEAQRLAAHYHKIVHPDDKSDHTAKKRAERAAELAPQDVDTLYLVARANEAEPGVTEAEVRQNERLAPLKQVVALEPAHAGALLDLAEFWSTLNPLPELANEYSKRALEAAPQSWRALGMRAAVLDRHGRSTEAQQLRKSAARSEEGRFQAEAIITLAEESEHRGDPAAKLALLEKAAHGGSSERQIVDALVSARVAHGDIDGAIAATEAWLERSPFDVSRMLATARLVEYAERPDDARKLIERALVICPEDSQAHFALARLAQRANDLTTADQELAEVLRLDPGYDKARRQRQLLATEQSQDRFEEPYRWDALERIGATSVSDGGNDRVQVLDRTTVWKVETDGTEHQYEHQLLQVTNSGGVKDLDNYWIGYPEDASLQVYNVRVIHPDKSFERAPAPRGSDQGWGGSHVRSFDLPPLQIGDCVEVEYRVDPTRPDVFGQYFGVRHVFQPEFPDPLAPTRRAELVVLTPADLPLFAKEQNGAALEKSEERKDGLIAYRWIAHDLKRPSLQTAMPDRSEFVPLVDVSTFESWQTFASWWWNFIEKEFVTTPAMKQKVAELTQGLATEEDKVRAIARFVGQDIRYNAWAFGTHGYQPYSAATIFERRFGDCKDKSILLRQMLAEIGVEAHPVLINAQYRRPDEKLDVAMVGHFNHCIAYVPGTGDHPGYYLDATADRNPIDYLRADDQGAKVLHVRDGQGSIHEIPYASPEENALAREYVVELDRAGSGVVKISDTSNGAFGVNLRYEFGGEKGDLKKRIADALAESFGKVDVLEAETSKLEDIGAPAKLEVELHADNLWTRDPSGANLRLSFDEVPLLNVAAEPAGERDWPLVLDRPFEMRTKVTYKLPPGSKVASLPPDADISAPDLVEYHLHAYTTPDGVQIERRFTLRERRISKERYADFQSALREIQLAESRTVVLEDTQGEKR